MWCERWPLPRRAFDGAVLCLAGAVATSAHSGTCAATATSSSATSSSLLCLSRRRPLCLVVGDDVRRRVWAASTPAQCAAAAWRHGHHQLPFLLSRHAATAALRAVCGRPVSFAGTRASALCTYGVHLGLAHEDVLAAAVAWPAVAADNAVTAYTADTAAGARFAVDVVDVSHVAALCTRHRGFAARCLPQCVAAAAVAARTRHGKRDDDDASDVACDATALQLAQHWSLRECCVKLLGVPGRAFAYGCVGSRADTNNNDNGDDHNADAHAYDAGVWREGAVYICELHGREAAAFAQHGLSRCVRATTWTLPLTLHDTVYPHVVTVASAQHARAP